MSYLITTYKVNKSYQNAVEIYGQPSSLYDTGSRFWVNFENLKVVIIGQDPYHGESQAHGLSFSVENNNIPPSLKNIFKELEQDLGINNFNSGNLTSWALEGVLLLNSSLTVESNNPNSHQNIGWKFFTDKVIEILEKSENTHLHG